MEVAKKNIEKYRLQAKKLIDRGKINKYFELSAKTGEGIYLFQKHLIIDSTIMIDKKLFDPLNGPINDNNETKANKFKIRINNF